MPILEKLEEGIAARVGVPKKMIEVVVSDSDQGVCTMRFCGEDIVSFCPFSERAFDYFIGAAIYNLRRSFREAME